MRMTVSGISSPLSSSSIEQRSVAFTDKALCEIRVDLPVAISGLRQQEYCVICRLRFPCDRVFLLGRAGRFLRREGYLCLGKLCERPYSGYCSAQKNDLTL